jgi:acylphosphatase
VRNNRDGSVEAVHEGEPDAVDQSWRGCGSVLRRAVVTSVVTTDEPPRNFGTFTVR